jgi:hypothetical protein
VRAVVVQNQVHVQIGGNLSLDGIQKPAELDRTMALVKLSDYLNGFQIESGEQGSCPVPFVVMSAALQVDPAAWVTAAVSDPAPGSGFSRPHTAPGHAPEG